MQDYIKEIIEDATSAYGSDFLEKITLKLNQVINADYTYIATSDQEYSTAELVVWVAKGQLSETFSYPLKDTPCSDVMCEKVSCFPSGVAEAYPQDQFLADLSIEGYIGTAIRDSKGKIMGLIAALYERDISEKQDFIQGLFQVFSGRIAAEMERQKFEESLEELNSTLELKVQNRTQELTTTLERLTKTQQQLVETEKMAALGRLVAGVAHEVNTPLGVAITAQSLMSSKFKEFTDKLDQEALTLQDMNKYRELTDKSLKLQGFNLNNAKVLIENFKRTAADQHIMAEEDIILNDYYQNVVSTLSSVLQKKSASIELDIDKSIRVRTLPGIHVQILTNLIDNSIKHGFSNNINNKITITARQIADKTVQVNFADNGKGLNPQMFHQVFEPFYTTARHEGGTGLGMSIIYNLITQSLKGEVSLLSTQPGFHLQYTFTSFK